MSPAEQLTLDGGSVPHDEVVRGPSTSRMVRRPETVAYHSASSARAAEIEFFRSLVVALDNAGVRPGDAFYVSRVPPVPVGAPTPGAARRSDPSTSHRAGAMVAPRTGSQRWALLYEFARAENLTEEALAPGPARGRTAEEAATAIGKPGAWRRVSELLGGGYIAETGDERPTRSGAAAEVYRITDKGRDALAAGRPTS